ncbi:MAG: oxidoreductase [Paenibacillus sp. RIFOXYA1_FULL_44_5]|nr:MAG: oxidoreductase [Paenibacillus sp. RIFOXYA1_FULL_44_5]
MLTGKIAVITGASSGIGAKLAELLSERGAIPILTARSISKLEAVSAHIHGQHQILPMDVTSLEQVQHVIHTVKSEYGKIDIVINNAGFGVFADLLHASMDEFAEMMDVNYMGTVRCTKTVLPIMLEQGYGHIVNVASIAGKIATAKSSGYSATKHAVIGFTNALRQELRGTGIHISTVNPGPVQTAFFERADQTGEYAKKVERFMLKPEQVALAVISAIEKKKTEVNLPLSMALGVRLSGMFPKAFEKLSSALFNFK